MKSKNLSENILRSVKSKGFKYIDLPSVIEANHIVQRSGENFRKFIFSFTDQNGSELCLRPDLTIASCLRYLENNLKGKEKIFYSGQAYRKSQNKKDSIIRNQIGFEILGSKDEKNDDKEIINTSLKSLQNIKYSSGTLTIGNVEIFNLLISKLDIPKRWKLRLARHFWREEYFNDLLKRLETNSDVDPTIVEIDKKRYVKMLKEDLSNIVAGRTINEILNKKDYFGHIDGLVVTGDISDDGSMESYLSAYEKLSKLNVPILAIPGNHDLRDPMRKVFHEHVQFSKNSSQFDWVFKLEETIIIGLDTLVEGENFGFLEEKSLDFLSNQLSNQNGSDLVLLIHHPPIKTGIYFMDQIGLTNSSDLSECLKATNRPVKILCGHVHGAVSYTHLTLPTKA